MDGQAADYHRESPGITTYKCEWCQSELSSMVPRTWIWKSGGDCSDLYTTNTGKGDLAGQEGG